MTSEPFEGRSAEMKKDSPWLASEDIAGLECKVTIEGVFRHQDVAFEAGRKVDKVYSVKFVNKAKQLVLNATNRKTLVGLFGPNVKEWKGKQVTLWVDENVKLAGKTVCGIRIK